MTFSGFERLLDDIFPNLMHPDPGFEIWSDFEAEGVPKGGPWTSENKVYSREDSKKSQIRQFWGKVHFGWAPGSILAPFWHQLGHMGDTLDPKFATWSYMVAIKILA